MLDGILVPQRLEQGVGETQREKILDRLLSEIVVDAEDAILGERLLEFGFDLEAGCEVVAERLLDADARTLVREPGGFQVACDGAEKIRRRREIEHDLGNMIELRGDRLVDVVLLHVARGINEAPGEPRPHLFGELRAHTIRHRLADLIHERAVLHRGTRRTHDREIRGQQSVGIQEIERGEQHGTRQVAGRTEYHDRLFAVHCLFQPENESGNAPMSPYVTPKNHGRRKDNAPD